MAPPNSKNLSTHEYKRVNGLALSLDVLRPSTSAEASFNSGPPIALIHFHGGFLVIGEKTTFPPNWLINACMRRGWTYVTPSYRLLPESTGPDIIDDALDATKWVTKNVTEHLIVAGSSAGGFLALSVATRMRVPPPIAVLSIYGMLDMTVSRYVEPGITLMGSPLLPNSNDALLEIDAARGDNELDGYPFPKEPSTDKRMLWIAAAHQEAIYPDLITGHSGLSAMIRKCGVECIPTDYRKLFPVAFGLHKDLPPVALLHGDNDDAVSVDQSIKVSDLLGTLGVKVLCEVVPEKGHGFDIRQLPPEVDVDGTNPTGELMYDKIKSVLSFLDNAVDQRFSHS